MRAAAASATLAYQGKGLRLAGVAAWLEIAADVLAQDRPEDGRDILTRELATSLHAGLVSRIALSAVDPEHIDITVAGSAFHPGPELWPTAAQVRAHPIARYHAASRDHSPVLMAHVLSAGFPLDAQSREIMHDLRISHQQLSIPVGTGAEYDGWVLVAEDRFDEREVEEARTIQRLLAGLDAHLRTLELVDRDRARDADVPELTSRERVILSLVAEGCTADAVARRLGISPRTVHKHQEHLYRKLGASDRLSAVLAAQRRGLCR